MTFDTGRYPAFVRDHIARIPASRLLETIRNRSLAEHASTAADFGRWLVARPRALPGNADLSTRLHLSYELELKSGLRLLLLAGAGFLIWGGMVPLSGAVVLSGSVVTESSPKKVQHPAGGVISDISVRDGDHVTSGQLLARLDETVARSNYQLLVGQLDGLRARIARLVAERDGSAEMKTPQELLSREKESEVAAILASERSLFKARATSRIGQREVLTGKIGQLEEQIRGLEAQIESQKSQRDLITTELQGIEQLYAKSLVPLTRLTSLQREAARIDGTKGQLQASIAETQGKVGEAKLQVARLDQDFQADVMKELRESQDKEGELVEKTVAARDMVSRIEIRAPASGTVHQLAVHTIGGVISPGEVIMSVVPDRDDLQIEAHLQARDIDQVRTGQAAVVKFPAFNQRTTPELNGKVTFVAADATQPKETGAPYYVVRVNLTGQELDRLGGPRLISGMPAELFLQGRSRTMISYLFKPISDQLSRVFKER